MVLAHGSGITPAVWHWWFAIACIVGFFVAGAYELMNPSKRRTPDAVRAVQARHAAPEPDEPDGEPVDEPDVEPVDDVPAPAKHSRDLFGRVGADAHWADELAKVGQGELLPPGTPTVSIDDFTDEELWEASFGADLRRLDNVLEEARRLCTANLVTAGIPLAVMQELDRRDLAAHERAVDHATVLTTTEFPAVAAVVKRRPECGPRARRDRKRANRALGR